MNLLPMRYFIAVVENEGISKAASELHITQQSLSAHMAALEKELGCRLFQRKPRFSLTYAGEVFLGYCKQFGNLSASMAAEFADIANESSGELRVGVATTRGRILLPEVILQFRKSYPGMQVHIFEGTNAELLARLFSGEIEIMVGNFAVDHPELAIHRLYVEAVGLLCPNSLMDALAKELGRRPSSITDFAACPFLMSDDDDIVGRMSNVLLEKAHLVPRVASKSRNIETLIKLCAEGCGVCFCTDYLAAGVLSESELSQFSMVPLGASYVISAAWKDKPYVSKAYVRFLELLRAQPHVGVARGQGAENENRP